MYFLMLSLLLLSLHTATHSKCQKHSTINKSVKQSNSNTVIHIHILDYKGQFQKAQQENLKLFKI